MKTTRKSDERRLLVTLTNEPFQPVRLYFGIPGPAFVTGKLHALECMVEVPRERCWQWLYCAESSSPGFKTDYDRVLKTKGPIVLGRIRFPERGGMTFQTNSILRAVEGARFLRSRLGPEVVALRCRVVNRCFACEEGRPDELMTTLDRDVTVIDPREGVATLRREFENVRSMEDPERAIAECLERKIEGGQDVPTVEDFPLYPEEETPEFQQLATALEFRLIRAVEHWRGNTHLTLTAIIVRAVEGGRA